MLALIRSTRCRTILVSAAVIVAAACCSAPDDDTAAAKVRIADAQAKYETYSADVEMTMGSGGTSIKSCGNVRGKADLYASRASVDISGNKQQYLTVKDAAGFVWEEREEDGEKSVDKSWPSMFDDVEVEGVPLLDASALLDRLMTWPGNLKDVLTTYANQYELKTAREDTLDGEQVFVFEGPMKESVGKPIQSIVEADAADNDKGPTAETLAIVFRHAAELATIRITIAQADGLPRIIEASRLDGTPSMKQTFKNVIINAPVEDASFVYTPPPGVRVFKAFSARDAGETSLPPSP